MRRTNSDLLSTGELLEFDALCNSYKVGYEMNKESTENCPNCGKKLVIVQDDNGKCCSKCGYVFSQKDGGGPESWTEEDGFKLEEELGTWSEHVEETKIGAYGNRTTIGSAETGNVDASGKPVPTDTKEFFGRVKKDKRLKIHGKKHLRSWDELNEGFKNLLDRTFSGSSLSSRENSAYDPIRKTATEYFQKCLKNGLQKGKDWKLVAASCIRLAQKTHGFKTDFDSIDDDISFRMKNFHMYRKLKTELDINFPDYGDEQLYRYLHEITTKICNSYEYGFKKKNEIYQYALKIIQNTDTKLVTGGRVPENVAAAAVYLSCKQRECKIDIYEMEKHVKPTSTTIQKIARDVLATQKHDKLYEALNPNQQKEIKGFLV